MFSAKSGYRSLRGVDLLAGIEEFIAVAGPSDFALPLDIR